MTKNKYVDTAAVVQVLGNVYNNVSLLDEEKYVFHEEDFSNDFHRILFGTIYNLHELGAKEITLNAIEDYLTQRPASYAIYKANKGAEYLTALKGSIQPMTFDYYYQRMKKFTLLRMYSEKCGMDLSDFYDIDNITNAKKKQLQEDWLDGSTLEEIADAIDKNIVDIRLKYVDNANESATEAGNGIFELIARLKETPEVGYPLFGHLINTVTRGARLKKLYLRSAATGVGKALPNSTIIPTPDGFKSVGKVKKGDMLFDAFGRPTRVIKIFPQGEREVWEVTFKDGRKAKCSKDHLWTFCTERQRPEQKLKRKFTTRSLAEINRMRLHHEEHGYQILVPMQKAAQYPEKEFAIEPYIFGLLLGGSLFRYNKIKKILTYYDDKQESPHEMNLDLEKAAADIRHNVLENTEEKTEKDIWAEEILQRNPELWSLNEGDKFIPNEYLCGSVSQRFDLLNGLLDARGEVDRKNGRVVFLTTSGILRSDVMSLCNSLGLKTSFYMNKSNSFVVDITGAPEDKIKLFTLQKKKEVLMAWYNNTRFKKSNLFNPIVKIRNLKYKEKMTCFLVDNEEHLFLMNDYIVTHNTRAMIADVCSIACDELFDPTEQRWVKNGTKEPAIYISTEQEKEEIQTLILAFISNVNEEHIITGRYLAGEYDRVKRAAEILQRAPLFIQQLPDFSLQDIENTIKRGIRDYDCRYVFNPNEG